MFRRFLSLLGVSSLLIAAPLAAASAADLYKAPPPPPPPAWSWQGIYLGLNGGGAEGTTDWQYTNPPFHYANHSDKGGLYGVTFGYNWQFVPWLVTGVEWDWDMGPLDGNTACPNPTFSCQTHITNIGTTRGRIGLAWDRLLVYGTGGIAWGDVTIQTVNLAGVPQAPSGTVTNGTSDIRMGWSYGAGLEYGIWSALSLKAEWIHYDLTSWTFGVDNSLNVYAKEYGDMFRAGVNWRFPSGPPGPAHW